MHCICHRVQYVAIFLDKGKNVNILTTPSHVFLVVKKADSVGCCGNTIFMTQWCPNLHSI